MAITAANFYWTGPRIMGSYNFYSRDNSILHRLVGNTAFSWDESGNWMIKKAGYTGGGNTLGYYFESASRVPHSGDNVFFTRLESQPGIPNNHMYPTTECLFGGITGPYGPSGGTWNNTDNSSGTAAQVGYLNLLQVDPSYNRIRNANFVLGNEFGSTFGQSYFGASASIVVQGLTGLSGNTGNLIFTNTDGSTVEFIGSTFYGYTAGGTYPGPGGVTGATYGGTFGTRVQEGKWIIGTKPGSMTGGIQGSTWAIVSIFNALRAGISGCGIQDNDMSCPCGLPQYQCGGTADGPLKMTITGYTGNTYEWRHGLTFTLTQNVGGAGGNTRITGSILNPLTAWSATAGISTNDPVSGVGNTGGFTGGTSSSVALQLRVKSDTLTHNSDCPVYLSESGLTRGFVLRSGQFNYNKGTIKQLVINRRTIDYLGVPQTSAYVTDTEFPSGSVVVSGGTYQNAGGSAGSIDLGGDKPISYIRASGGIQSVVVDAFRRGHVIIDAEVSSSMTIYPEKDHAAGIQGHVEINRPIAESERFNYPSITLKSFNPDWGIAGSTKNNQLVLNSGLTIGTLDLEAGTVSVGQFIGDRPITISDGSISGKGLLKARNEFNPSYTGFRIGGDDFPVQPSTGGVTLPEGILIYDPSAEIQFSAGHYVLAAFLGNTGSDEAFQNPGSPLPPGSPGAGAGGPGFGGGGGGGGGGYG